MEHPVSRQLGKFISNLYDIGPNFCVFMEKVRGGQNEFNWVSKFAASKKTKIGKCRLERRFSAYFSFAYKTIVK